MAFDVIDELASGSRSLGKLHSEICPKGEPTRDHFEELVGAMARAGLVRLTDAVFEKDGKQIPFRKASLTRNAQHLDRDAPLALTIKDAAIGPVKAKKSKRKTKSRKNEKTSRPARPQNAKAEGLLREWRLAVAKRQGVPAFRIMTDRVLLAIAANHPGTAAELLAIPGIGINSVEKYGAQIYRILNQASLRDGSAN